MKLISKNKQNSSLGRQVDGELHNEVLRIIGNVRQEHNIGAMARGRYGLPEFGRLAGLLGDVSTKALSEYLDLIDEVERSHDGFLCSMKFIAFNVLFCGVRLPQRRQFYVQRYECRMEEATTGRGFMQEVELASWNAANPHPNPRVEIAPLDGD